MSSSIQILFPRLLKTILEASLALLLAVPLLATGQEPDRIRIAGKEYSLFANPLEAWLSGLSVEKRPSLSNQPGFSFTSSNWRGYVATWEIRQSKLFLVRVDGWVLVRPPTLKEIEVEYNRRKLMVSCGPFNPKEPDLASLVYLRSDPKRWAHCELKKLFKGQTKDGHVFASWFTGELRIPEGEMLRYVHMGYGSVYERERFIQIKDGLVVSEHVVDNRAEAIPGEMELMRQELEKMEQETREKPASPLNQKLLPDPPKAP